MQTGKTQQRQAGLTYITVLMIIAVAGVMLAGAGINWSQAGQREKEIELLYVGNAYRQAIMQYYERTPGMLKRYPNKLEDLLTDTRYNTPHHYLRKLYLDPIKNQQEWNIIIAPEGGIMGVQSVSIVKPIKTTGFDEIDASFEGTESYSAWKFTYVPQVRGPQQVKKQF